MKLETVERTVFKIELTVDEAKMLHVALNKTIINSGFEEDHPYSHQFSEDHFDRLAGLMMKEITNNLPRD